MFFPCCQATVLCQDLYTRIIWLQLMDELPQVMTQHESRNNSSTFWQLSKSFNHLSSRHLRWKRRNETQEMPMRGIIVWSTFIGVYSPFAKSPTIYLYALESVNQRKFIISDLRSWRHWIENPPFTIQNLPTYFKFLCMYKSHLPFHAFVKYMKNCTLNA